MISAPSDARPVDLHLRRVAGITMIARMPSRRAAIAHSARVIARRESDDSALPLLRRELKQADWSRRGA